MTAFPLRPMDVGDILDASFRIYRERFRLCFLLGLFPSVTFLSLVPVQLMFATMNSRGLPFLEVLAAVCVFMSAIIFLVLILSSLTIAAITHLVSEQFLGRTLRFSHLLPVIRRCFVRLVLATGVFTLLMLLICTLFFLSGFVAFYFALQQNPFMGPAAIVLLVLCVALLAGGLVTIVYTVLSFLLVSQVIVIEDLPTLSAIFRSRRLIMTHTTRGFLSHPVQRAGMLLVIVFIIQCVISGVGMLPSEAAAFFVLRAPQLSGMGFSVIVAATLFHVLINALVTPLSTIVLVLFYYDLRIRGEGLDLEMAARRLAAAAEDAT